MAVGLGVTEAMTVTSEGIWSGRGARYTSRASAAAKAEQRGPSQVKGIIGPVEVDGLVAHPSEDLTAECVVVCLAGQTESLDEIPLGQAGLFEIVGHPPGDAGSHYLSADSECDWTMKAGIPP
jgi:hypothetical protein